MPKVAQQDLDEFGRAVKRARSLKGWTLDQLGGALTPASGKSFLSNVEKGQRSIGPLTVGKLIAALALPETWIDRFLDADIAPEAEETPQDLGAERLMRMYARDATAPESAEGLLIGLAEKFSTERFIDHFTAYASLKSALETAAEMKARGALPQNTDSQLDAVLREVTRLNDDGLFEEAAAVLDAEVLRLDASREAIFQQQLNQDRIRNRPEDAANRIVANLKRSAPSGGVFNATRELLLRWRENGETLGRGFDLQVALALGLANEKRKRGVDVGFALADVAQCYFSLGDRHMQDTYLNNALRTFTLAIKEFPRQHEPQNWSATKLGIGNTLQSLGRRNKDPGMQRAAIAAYKASLIVRTREAMPEWWATSQSNLANSLQALGEIEKDSVSLRASVVASELALLVRTQTLMPTDWAMTQNNLGLAFRWLGELERDPSFFVRAELAYSMCLSQYQKDAVPFYWAMTKWNLADLAFARHDLSPDPALLQTARTHVTAAREVFADGSDYQTARCDELLAKIAALEA